VIHQQNKGLPGARNSGIEYVLSHGAMDDDYIAFLDSDDVWVPNVVTDTLLETCTDHEIIVFPRYDANESLTRFQRVPLQETGTYDGLLSVWALPIGVCNRFYRVSVFQHNPIRFQEDVKCHEDVCFTNFLLYFAKHFLFLDSCLYFYRQNPRSIMHTVVKQQITTKIAVIDGLLDGIQLFQIQDETFRNQIYDYCCVCFLNLAEKHYESLHLDNAPYRILEGHPVGELLRSHDIRLAQRERDRIYNMMHHRMRFKCKYFFRGIVSSFKQLLCKIPMLCKIYDQHRFPLTAKDIAVCQKV